MRKSPDRSATPGPGYCDVIEATLVPVKPSGMATALLRRCFGRPWGCPHEPEDKDSPVSAVLNVEQPHPGHLYWPDLDVDLALESITSPEKFPLIARP